VVALTACLRRDYSHVSDNGDAKTRRKDTTTDQQFLSAISTPPPPPPPPHNQGGKMGEGKKKLSTS